MSFHLYAIVFLLLFFSVFIFFKIVAIYVLDIKKYMNREQQPGYAAEMHRLIWAFVVRTRKKNHFATTWL